MYKCINYLRKSLRIIIKTFGFMLFDNAFMQIILIYLNKSNNAQRNFSLCIDLLSILPIDSRFFCMGHDKIKEYPISKILFATP